MSLRQRVLHEIKHDGFRVIARKTGNRVKLYSRPGNDLTERFPRITEAVARLRARTCIIDGEAVACGPDDIARFDLIRDWGNDEQVFLRTFDLIELNGDDLRREPLINRKGLLVVAESAACRSWPHPNAVVSRLPPTACALADLRHCRRRALRYRHAIATRRPIAARALAGLVDRHLRRRCRRHHQQCEQRSHARPLPRNATTLSGAGLTGAGATMARSLAAHSVSALRISPMYLCTSYIRCRPSARDPAPSRPRDRLL
jgi:hypothetical protein